MVVDQTLCDVSDARAFVHANGSAWVLGHQDHEVRRGRVQDVGLAVKAARPHAASLVRRGRVPEDRREAGGKRGGA